MYDPKAMVMPTAPGEIGRTYYVPTYKVTDEGMADGEPFLIPFCKGDRNDPDKPRQEGVFTESLLTLSKKYLEAVNVGDLENPDTTQAIYHIEQALISLGNRAKNRQDRGVQGTYQK